MSKRSISMLCAICMMLGTAACSSEPPAAAPAASSSPAASAAASSEASAPADGLDAIMNREGLPIIKEGAEMPDITIFWAANPIAPDPEEMMWIKQNAEETGVHMNWQKNPSEGAVEKVNLLISSGDYPDVFWNTVEPNMVVQYLDQDVFLPTQDLIEEYMPNYKKVLDARPEYKSMCVAPDGNMYGFAYIEEMYGLVNSPGAMVIYQPWLDALGLSMPTTLDELTEVLHAMQGKDLNGNGIQDEYPLCFNYGQNGNFGSQNIINHVSGLFGQGVPVTGAQDDYLTGKDGKLLHTATTESYRDMVVWLHGLYQDGCIDPASFTPSTNSSGIIAEKMSQGVPLVGVASMWNRMTLIPDKQLRDGYVAVPRLESGKGKSGVEINFSELQSPTGNAITTKCKYPEIVARWVDYSYDPYQSITQNWGLEGYIFVRKENGLLGYDFNPDGTPNLKDGLSSITGDMRSFCTPVRGSLAILSDYYDTLLEYPTDTKNYLLDSQIINGKYDVLDEYEALPRLWLLPEEQNRVSQIVPQIKNVIDSNTVRWIVDGGIEEEWDQYLAELDAAGLPEFVSIYQSVYDRYLANL